MANHPENKISVKGIYELLGMEASADERFYTNVSGFEGAGLYSIVFAETQSALEQAMQSSAGLILVPKALADPTNFRLLGVANAKYAFAAIEQWLRGCSDGAIHPTAMVEAGATIGEGTSVGAYTLIEAGAFVGAACMIGSHVTIHGRVTLGDRAVIQSGVVLGSMGFGYVRGPDGRYLRFPQIGTLWIGDEVEIGANSTIDRGALGETRIGRGTKIDNLVHIAHNCRIGEDVMIAAQVGIAGSTQVGDGAILAGQVGLAEHVTIGPEVIVGAQGGVPTSKKLSGRGDVFWGTPARPIKEYLKDLARLRRKK